MPTEKSKQCFLPVPLSNAETWVHRAWASPKSRSIQMTKGPLSAGGTIKKILVDAQSSGGCMMMERWKSACGDLSESFTLAGAFTSPRATPSSGPKDVNNSVLLESRVGRATRWKADGDLPQISISYSLWSRERWWIIKSVARDVLRGDAVFFFFFFFYVGLYESGFFFLWFVMNP